MEPMGAPDLVERLAVGLPDGPYSATFRIWTSPGKSDVYASVRERAGDFKVSLHESGTCNAGLTDQFATKEADAVTAIGESRHQSTWTRAMHTGSRIVAPLQFAVPANFARGENVPPETQRSCGWVPHRSGAQSSSRACFLGQS